MSMEMWVHGPTGTVFGLSGAASGCVLGLRALTDFAAFDIGFNSFLHLWPPVFSEDQLLRLLRFQDVQLGHDRGTGR